MKTKTISGSQATPPTTSEPAESDGYLTPMELANQLRVSTRTVQRYRLLGMPARGRGKVVRYYVPEVREWIRIYFRGARQL